MHKFTDFHGHMFLVNDRNNSGTGCFELGARIDDGTIWRAFPVDEAPAIALAILEAAGIEYVTTAEAANPSVYIGPERLAATSLQEWSRLRSKRAEREAEDAKVAAWWDETRYGHTTSLCWGHMGESAHEDVRKQYRLARKFFEEA